jgi:hypothetical protein
MSTSYNRDAMADLMSSLATYALNAQIPGASSTQQAAQGVSFTNSDGGVAAGDAGKSNVGMQYITPSQTTQGRITPFATTADTSSSTSQGPDLFQSLYDMGAFNTQNVLPLDTSALTPTSQGSDFFQSLYNEGYLTGSPVNPGGNYGFSVGNIGSSANLTDAIPTVTTPGFSIGNTDNAVIGPNRPGVGFLTNMTPVYGTSTLENTGFQLSDNSALGGALNFDALGGGSNLNSVPTGSNIERIDVTGQRLNQGNTLNSGALASLNTNLDLGGGDGGDGEPREPDEDQRPIEEILVTGVRNAANTLIRGLPLFTGAYNFIKDLPEGDFTPDELNALNAASNAANVYVDPQATFTEGGTGTTTTLAA